MSKNTSHHHSQLQLLSFQVLCGLLTATVIADLVRSIQEEAPPVDYLEPSLLGLSYVSETFRHVYTGSYWKCIKTEQKME